jgi:hypothetical protein
MALIHQATVVPSKLALLSVWLPSRPWFTGEADVKSLGSFRFDDPSGAVGIETILLQAGNGPVLQVPLTYRDAPRIGAEEFLVGITEHSVLGTRWVYDGCGDPVLATALATAVLTGGTQAAELVDKGGYLEPRVPSVTVSGSGTAGTPVAAIDTVSCRDDGATTVVQSDTLELIVVRVVGTMIEAPHTLTGSWADGGPAVLAGVRPR